MLAAISIYASHAMRAALPLATHSRRKGRGIVFEHIAPPSVSFPGTEFPEPFHNTSAHFRRFGVPAHDYATAITRHFII